jgi:hypothetical protein
MQNIQGDYHMSNHYNLSNKNNKQSEDSQRNQTPAESSFEEAPHSHIQNILQLQRTIGNQAVMRMIKQRTGGTKIQREGDGEGGDEK